MPLVVPGLNSVAPKSQAEDWTMKLLGKSIGEKNDETVSPPPHPLPRHLNTDPVPALDIPFLIPTSEQAKPVWKSRIQPQIRAAPSVYKQNLD
jgi:hypothetical protein